MCDWSGNQHFLFVHLNKVAIMNQLVVTNKKIRHVLLDIKAASFIILSSIASINEDISVRKYATF